MGVEGIGASVVRKEDRRFITGKGRYVDDIKLVGMTYAHFVRSPHAHAKVKGIDSAAAMKMPGVVGALTGKEIVEDKVGNLICGWHIGAAAASDAAFKNAANVVALDIVNNRLVPNAMEPRAAIAEYNEAEEHFTLYTTSQNPHVARLVLSAFYNIAQEHKLRVIAPDVGGGFGSKIYIYPEEMVALWASKKVRRPVKWTGDRSEAFLTDAHGRDHISKAEMAFDKDNKILALRVKTHANLGAYMSLFSSAVPTYLYATLLSGQYNIPAIHAEIITVYTNTTPVDAYRGAGRPEASYLLERLMETAARQLKVDPAELRRNNFITQFPYQTPAIMTYDVGDRKSTRLNSSHQIISYAVFCLKKKKHI